MTDDLDARLHKATGELAAVRAQELLALGKRIAESKQGWGDLDPGDAVVKYLVERHRWRPADVRSMGAADLLLCLEPLDLKDGKPR